MRTSANPLFATSTARSEDRSGMKPLAVTYTENLTPSGISRQPCSDEDNEQIYDEQICNEQICNEQIYDEQIYGRLLQSLQRSFGASQNAILSLDLAALEPATRKQTELSQALKILSQRKFPEAGSTGRLEDSSSSAIEPLGSERALLHSARVQLALLARARHRLRVVVNTLAGCSTNYGPPMPTAVVESRTLKRRKVG